MFGSKEIKQTHKMEKRIKETHEYYRREERELEVNWKLRFGNWALKKKTLYFNKHFLNWALEKHKKERCRPNRLKRKVWAFNDRVWCEVHERLVWHECLEKELKRGFWMVGFVLKVVKALEKVEAFVGVPRKLEACLSLRSLCIFCFWRIGRFVKEANPLLVREARLACQPNVRIKVKRVISTDGSVLSNLYS